ncbi:MAG: CvpA family protein [Ignavibacteriales bacterium]
MSWIDIIIGIYLLYSVVSGWRRGLAACFFGIAAGLLSIIGAVTLCKPAVALLDEYTGAVAAVSSHIQRVLGTSLPSATRMTGILGAMRVDLSPGIKPAADLLGRAVMAAVCFFVLLILIRIVLLAVSRVMVFPFEHGPAALINRLAGAAFGGVLGFANVAILWVIMMLLAAVGVTSPDTIQSSVFLSLAGDLVARVAPWVMGRSLMGGV